ncbi:MAG: PD-(D/E)XK nuclease family protein [Acidobacteriota bacterium]
MSRRIVLSSGTERQLQAARAWIRKIDVCSELVVVAPTWGAADDFVRRCSQKPGGLLGFHRMTLLQLASDIAIPALASRSLAPITALGAEALSARTIYACQGDLGYFVPVADTPGFAKALVTTLKELRMEGLMPSGLREGGPPGCDLARLLERYQRELESGGLADPAMVFRLARERVRQGEYRFDGLPLLFLSVTAATDLERRFVSALADRAPTVLATVLAGDQSGTEALEAALATRAENLDVAAPSASSGGRAPEPPAPDGISRLQRLRHYLFEEKTAAGPPGSEGSETDLSLEFFSEPGEGRECVEMARRIRFAADEGIRFDQTAILLRSPKTYLPLVEEALRRAGIPAYFTRGTIRPHPAGRAFLALLECACEGLSASRFAEYLSLGQVPLPDAAGAPLRKGIPWVEPLGEQLCFKTLGPQPSLSSEGEESPRESQNAALVAGTLRTPFQWEKLLVDAAVIGGRDRWLRRLKGLESEFRVRLKTLTDGEDAEQMHLRRELERLAHLQSFALPLIEKLDDLPAEARWGEWLTALEELASISLKNPQSVLSVLAELRPMAEVGPTGLDEVKRVLSERLVFLPTDPPTHRHGRVLVATIAEAAGRSFELVLLPGLAEGIFPRKGKEDPLLLDSYREKLGVGGFLEKQRRDERLLLRSAVAAARTRLLISYPRMDMTRGRSRVPSFYALDVLRAAEGRLPDVPKLEKRASESSQSRLGWPAPRDCLRAVDDAEYDLALLGPFLDRPAVGRRGRARFLLEVNAHLARSLRARWWRWSSRFSVADGIVDADPRTQHILDGQRLRARSYSPTALQHFAACPYRFLLYAIHNLRPREDAAAVEQMDPLTRGGLFHEVQFELLKQLREAGLLPMTTRNQASVMSAAEDVFDRVVTRYEEELSPAIPRVWRSEIEALRSDLIGWILQTTQSEEDWEPYRFEFAFGLRAGPERDPTSTADEAVVGNGVRLRGSIDLVERNPKSGTLRVTDHKTGKARQDKSLAVKGGEVLQPLLYGLAAEKLLRQPVESGQLFFCTQKGGYQRLDVPLNAVNRGRIDTVLQTIDRALETGFLPAAPRPGACDFCDYRIVCGPYEELRLARKKTERLADLEELRKLP